MKTFLGAALATQPDGKRTINYVSPSALDTAKRCVRRYYYRYVLKQKEPETAAQQTGIEGHEQIANFLKTGVDTRGPIAQAGRRLLDRDLILRGSPLIEAEIHYRDDQDVLRSHTNLAGVPVIGFLDLAYVDQDPTIGVVVDHKFKSSLEWQTTPSALRTDLAMSTYGNFVLNHYNSVEKIRITHHTYCTKKARGVYSADSTSVLLEPVDIARNLDVHAPLVRSLQEEINNPNVDDVPYNSGSCGDYGGCPHRGYCKGGAQAVLNNLFGEGFTVEDLKQKEGLHPMSLLNRSKKLDALKSAVAASPDVVSARALLDAVHAATADRGKIPLAGSLAVLAQQAYNFLKADEYPGEGELADIDPIKNMDELRAIALELELDPDQITQAAIAKSNAALAGALSAATATQPILSPDAPKSNPDLASQTRIDAKEAQAKEAAAATAVVTETAEPVTATLRTRGRKAAAVAQVTETVTIAPSVVEATVTIPPAEAVKVTPVVAQETKSPSETYLLVGCTANNAKPFSTFTQPLFDKLKEACKVDPRLVPNDHALAYSKWKAAFQEVVRLVQLPPGFYEVNTNSEIEQLAFEVVASSAVIIRGVR
ncbi:cas system-associated protein [Caudoviricetes sp.]|nr:cas system-associated protein [Caudoviricetes sp.]